MSTPEEHSKSDVSPPQADERLAGESGRPAGRKAAGKAAKGQGGDAGMAELLARFLGVRSGTRGLAILGVVGLGLLLVIAVGWSWFVARHPQGVPVIGPPPYAVKDRPADPGGMMIMEDDTTKSDATGRGAVHLAPPPEQPDAGLLAGRLSSHPAGDGHDGAHAGEGAETGSTPPADGRSDAQAVREKDHAQSEAEKQPAETPHQADARRDEVAEQPLSQPAPLPPPLSTGEAKREQRDAARQDEGRESRKADSASGSASAPSSAAAGASSTASSGEGGHYEVQLAALQNDAQARQEWEHLRRRMPDLLGGHEPVLRKVEIGGKSFVRLRVGGFADRAAARQLCVQLHAQAQACSVTAN